MNEELKRLLERARHHKMTPEEIAEQRASWVRGEMAIGNDRDERAYREAAKPPAAE